MTPIWLMSVDITVAERARWKDENIRNFQPTLSTSTADESHSVDWKLMIYFHSQAWQWLQQSLGRYFLSCLFDYKINLWLPDTQQRDPPHHVAVLLVTSKTDLYYWFIGTVITQRIMWPQPSRWHTVTWRKRHYPGKVWYRNLEVDGWNSKYGGTERTDRGWLLIEDPLRPRGKESTEVQITQ